MFDEGILDVAVHQWSADLNEMAELVPKKYKSRLKTKARIQDPVTGTLVPTLPWYGAYWNEDSPDYERPESGEFTNSERYKSPERMNEWLAARNVEKAIMSGHELRFLSALPDPEYTAALASAWNEHLVDAWLEPYDRMKGGILLAMNNVPAAVEEIEKWADHSEMVTVIVLGGQAAPLGSERYHPVYEAATDADLPITIHSSGNPVQRQTAGGIPELFETWDVTVGENHMANAASMVFENAFDKYPDLKTVWAGEGVGWFLHPMWRGVRVYRNQYEVAPHIDRDPEEYYRENCWFTTHPLGSYSERNLELLIELVGADRILYASGYPDYDHDKPDELASLPEAQQRQIFQTNAAEIYGL